MSILRKKPYQRYAVGLSYIPVSGSFDFRTIDEFGVADTNHSVNVKGWGAGVVYSFVIPVARTGEKTIAAINIGLSANYYLFDVDDVTIRRVSANYNSTSSYSGPGAGFMFGLPVGLDLITGGEASLDRANRFSFAVGAGVMPLVSMAAVHEFGGLSLRVPPYVKAEIGFHFGINWKVRASYLTKSAISFSDDSKNIFDIDTNIDTKLKANDRFIISLMVQPFSFGWD